MNYLFAPLVAFLGSLALVSGIDTLRHHRSTSSVSKYIPSVIGSVFYVVAIFSTALFAHGRNHSYNAIALMIVAIIGAVFTALSIHIGVQDRFFSKSKSELFQLLLNDLQHASFSEVRSMKYIFRHALCSGAAHIVLATSLLTLVSILTHLTIISLYASVEHPNIQCDEVYLVSSFALSFILHLLSVALLVRLSTLFTHAYIRMVTAIAMTATQLITYYLLEMSMLVTPTTSPRVSTTMSAVLDVLLVLCPLVSVGLLNYTTMYWRWRVTRSSSSNSEDEHSVIMELTKRFASQPVSAGSATTKTDKYRSVQVQPVRLSTPVMSLQASYDENHVDESVI